MFIAMRRFAKKKSLFGIVFLILLLSVVGCSSKASGPAAGPGTNEDTIVIRIDNPASEGGFVDQGLHKFKELVEERTNGRVIAEIYSGGQLSGNDASVGMHLLKDGDVDAGFLIQGFFAQLEPRWSIFLMPFLFETTEQSFAISDSEVGEYMLGLLPEHGYIGLADFLSGIKVLTNSVRPVVTPDDLSGLKIRSPDSPMNIAIISAMGAHATVTSMGELFVALQQGVVDGQENAISTINDRGFMEVQDYVTVTEHEVIKYTFAMNKSFFESLPEDVQEIVLSSAKEAALFQRELALQGEKNYLKKFEEDGAEVRYLTAEEKQLWIDKLEPIYDQYRDDIGDEVMDMFLEALGR